MYGFNSTLTSEGEGWAQHLKPTRPRPSSEALVRRLLNGEGKAGTGRERQAFMKAHRKEWHVKHRPITLPGNDREDGGMISETTLNVLLAELLEKRGLFGASELIFKRREKVRKPDVLVRIQGVRVILEGKILKATAKQELSTQCLGRIDDGLADVSIGVIYKLQHPDSLVFSNVEVKQMLEGSTFEVAVWSAGAAGPRAAADWTEVELDSLVRLVRSSVNEAASQDLLREAVNQMREALDRAVERLMQETMDKFAQLAKDLANLVEVPEPKKDEEFVRAVKMALLVLMDAIIFYNVIAPGAELPSLESLKRRKRVWSSLFKMHSRRPCASTTFPFLMSPQEFSELLPPMLTRLFRRWPTRHFSLLPRRPCSDTILWEGFITDFSSRRLPSTLPLTTRAFRLLGCWQGWPSSQ